MRRYAQRLRQVPGQLYAGLSIIFAADFHQIHSPGQPLRVKYFIHWQDAIYCAIFLESDHRFKYNPAYG